MADVYLVYTVNTYRCEQTHRLTWIYGSYLYICVYKNDKAK